MLPFRPLAGPVGRSLQARLDDLREDLDLLGQRLREGLAQAVGQAAACAVRDTVLALLSDPHLSSFRTQVSGRFWSRSSSFWDAPAGEFSPEEEDYSPSTWDDEDAGGMPNSEDPVLMPWLSALAAGWQIARWYLRRRPSGAYPVLTILALGLAAGLAALGCPTLAASAVGLVGAALDLVILADAATSDIWQVARASTT